MCTHMCGYTRRHLLVSAYLCVHICVWVYTTNRLLYVGVKTVNYKNDFCESPSSSFVIGGSPPPFATCTTADFAVGGSSDASLFNSSSDLPERAYIPYPIAAAAIPNIGAPANAETSAPQPGAHRPAANSAIS